MASARAMARAGLDALDWYRDARAPLAVFAASAGRTERDTAYALAAFSPRVRVRRSVTLARAALAGHAPEGSLPGARTAWRYYLDHGHLRGPKTDAFARALLGDECAVVVDVWTLRALSERDDRSPRGREYGRLVSRVRRVARYLGTEPARAQAALWVGALRARSRAVPSMAQILKGALHVD